MILDRFRLDGQVAVVTGAGRGLGAAVAVAFAEVGADVLIAARTKTELESVAAQIEAVGRRAHIVVADLAQPESTAELAAQAVEAFGKLDIVVVRPLSLAGVASRIPAFFNGTLKADDKVLMRTAAEAEISSDLDIWFHVDGEPRRGASTVVLRTRSRVLTVRVKY